MVTPVKACDFVPVWQVWDAHHGDRQTRALVDAETMLGLPFGLQHHEVHGVLIAWRRAGLNYGAAFDAFISGARTLLP